MTGVIGGACLACGTLAALVIADVPVAVIAGAAVTLGLGLVLARLRWRWLRGAVARPRWTDDDRDWLRRAGAALPEGQERLWASHGRR